MKTKLFILAIIAMTIVSCKQNKKGKENRNTIHIGATLDFTGPNATYGNQVKEGMDLAIEQINTSNAKNDLSIKIEYLDSKSEPKLAVNNAQKLINVNDIKILIGEVSSNATQAMIPVVEKNDAMLFAPASSSPKLENISKNFVRNWPSDDSEAISAANLAIDVSNEKRASIVFVNSDYGIGLKNKFKKEFLHRGGKILEIYPYEVGNSDFKTIILKLKQNEQDIIYLAGNPNEMGNFMKQLRQFNMKAIIFSDTGFLQNTTLKIAGKAANDVIVPTPDYMPSISKVMSVEKFYNSFKEKYGKDPTLVNANGYDAIYLIVQAYNKFGDKPMEIIAYLRNLKEYTGASGKISFTNGDVQTKIVFKTVIDGKIVDYNKKETK